jgi:hypothetical protein
MIFFHILFGLPQVSIQQRLITPENLGHPELLIGLSSVSLSQRLTAVPRDATPQTTRGSHRHAIQTAIPAAVDKSAVCGRSFRSFLQRAIFGQVAKYSKSCRGNTTVEPPPSVFEKKFGHSFQATPTSVSNATLTSPVDSVIAYLNSYVDPAACPLTRLVNPLPMAHVP